MYEIVVNDDVAWINVFRIAAISIEFDPTELAIVGDQGSGCQDIISRENYCRISIADRKKA